MDSIVLEEPPTTAATSAACDGSGGGSRAIDRHNPIIRDDKRLGQSAPGTITSTNNNNQPRRDHHLCNQKPEVEGGDQKRKSTVAYANEDEFFEVSDLISSASSSRCLPPSPPPSPPERLDFHRGTSLPPQPPSSPPCLPCDGIATSRSPPHEHLKFHPSKAFNNNHDEPQTSPTTKSPSSNQVVVLEVAFHCRGCERKMKKHISKIEGVTSFKTEFAAKKVTVVGDVTPLAVLTSVLKVRNAKLLTPPTISSSSSSSTSTGIGLYDS